MFYGKDLKMTQIGHIDFVCMHWARQETTYSGHVKKMLQGVTHVWMADRTLIPVRGPVVTQLSVRKSKKKY